MVDQSAMDRPRLPERVLLIAPRYFGYENDIVEEMLHQGMQVDLVPDRPFSSPIAKALTRFRPEFARPAADRFFASRIEELGRTHYDLILVAQGEAVSSRTLTMLRTSYPTARLLFYTWDSLDNKPFSRANLKYYDRCFSFDLSDAATYGMTARPLFFSRGFERQMPSEFEFDLSFIGTIHSDRYRILNHINRALLPGTRTYWYLYLQAPWMYQMRKLFTADLNGARRSEFQFQPLDKATVQRIFLASRVVLDIEHPKQRGVTMRTIETIGSHTKLVTTNSSAREYDFFDARNILIINRQRPEIDPQFISAPYIPLPPDVYDKYRLSHWIREVCSS